MEDVKTIRTIETRTNGSITPETVEQLLNELHPWERKKLLEKYTHEYYPRFIDENDDF